MRVCALHAAGRIDTDNFNDLTICFGWCWSSFQFQKILCYTVCFSYFFSSRGGKIRTRHARRRGMRVEDT